MKTIKSTVNTFMLAIVFLLLITSCSNDDDNTPTPQLQENMVDVGDYNLFAESFGEGNHTLVFESGLGDNYESWYKLLGLSESNQVIAYNRAGYEPSDVANNDRNIIQLAEDLHQVIISKSENEKVILVGHSLGGAVIRYYAVQHPEMVEALLFVDPSHEDFEVVTQVAEDAGVAFFMENGSPEAANEYAQIIENFEILENLTTLPDVPTIVLTSIKDRLEVPENAQHWIEVHATLGEGVSDFTHLITEDSGHYIQIEEPQLVIDAINALLD
ncbi:pimeloyl-ACP methyl ester carboxylesterase [Maribacter vaceletii]|uniref:Pimeloyl-ACP methyl ester carboxylesterase n=1 Tax=Maribacter vaceletii TaxID=1206816 RepID=A0A495E7Y9_9FLAO|nr:alpha/beta hydrolase [Maribacter vaceletii]RKR13065.1 pimeloyl-ACP methyl ester carboxylesterase [Maribacter vaceletii]